MSYQPTLRRPHPPIYYTVRTVVRGVFWTLVATGAILTVASISKAGQKPQCPITLNSDFTYTTNAPFTADECYAGNNVTLLGNGRWEWTN